MASKKIRRADAVETRLKDIQHEVLVAVASGQPLAEVMSLLCLRAEDIAPNAICSILRIDQEGRLRPIAAPSLPDFIPAASRASKSGRWSARAAAPRSSASRLR